MLIWQIPANQTIRRDQVQQRTSLTSQGETVGNVDTVDTGNITDTDMVSDLGKSDTKKCYFTSVQPTSCLE
jgi:hypothetical protein